MAKVIFTPWKSHADLLAVRNQFYPPPEYAGPDMRSHACATVGAWKIRGNLPHPVEATALLTDAILHDNAAENSLFAIRATYAAAFCRFVTGLVDSKLHGGPRKTMFARAMDLGLPASFVELRHEATHRELPSLTVLRDSTVRSLEWLWGFYWGREGVEGRGSNLSASAPASGGLGLGEGSMGDDLDGGEGFKSEFRGVLERVRGITDAEGGNELSRKKSVQTGLAGVAGDVISILKTSSRVASGALAQVLLQEGILVPTGRRLGDSLTETITKWDPLLHLIVGGYVPFLAALTEAMMNELAFTGSADSNSKNDPHREGVYTWLDHILSSAQWGSQRRLLSYSYILAVCEASSGSNHWTALLQKSIGGNRNTLPMPEFSNKRVGASEMGGLDDDLKMLSKFGWDTADTWDNRSLGIV